jgi:lipopolysaccharide heptosyltransferase I
MPIIKNPEKILIVKPSSLGDVVHSLPFLNVAKTCFPNAEIHWVIAKGLENLLEGHSMIDKLVIIHKDMWKKITHAQHTVKEIKALLKRLKQEKYDLVIDLQGLLRSGIITKATNAPIRAGFQEAREGSRLFYTHKVKGGKDIHAVDRYLKIAAYLGCDISDIRFPFPSHSMLSLDQSLFSEDYAVIIPGARWKTKVWPAGKFGKLASKLYLKTVIAGGESEIEAADTIVSLSQGKSISLAGKTGLKELVEVIRHAQFVVSNDSGPMHIAAALKIPVFAIFGPTDQTRTGPYGKGHTIIREDVTCAPCFKKTCNDMKCMNDLSVEKVYKTIKRTTALQS